MNPAQSLVVLTKNLNDMETTLSAAGLVGLKCGWKKILTSE
jgi:hypothetical protein